jgi:hypothetical protein
VEEKEAEFGRIKERVITKIKSKSKERVAT